MAIPFVRDFDDLAENIANPPLNRPIGRAVGEFGRNVCDRISARPELYTPTILQSPLRTLCQPYWDSQGVDGPTVEAPFTGGQCAATYRPSGTFVRECEVGQPLGSWQAETSGPGPISGVTLGIRGAPNLYGIVYANGTDARLSGPGGVLITRQNVACNQISTPGRVALPGSVKITNVGPIGHADDCGNPPDIVEPGDNPAVDPGPQPPGTGPQFDIRGNPVFVLPPTLTPAPGLTVEFSPGEINLGSGTGNNSPEPPLGAEEFAGTASGNGGGDNDFGNPPDGERWVGCCILLTSVPQGSGGIPQSHPETIFLTTIGNVRLIFGANSNPPTYDTPINNRQKTTCIWEPVPGMQPTGVRVNLLPFYGYSVVPYSVPIEN